MADGIDERPRFVRRLGGCIGSGAKKGFRGAAKLLAIMVPVSFVVTILNWAGVLGVIARWLKPLFGLVGLPGETALVFVTGVLLNIYSAIAVMGSIPLTSREVTILALACLISHNFPIEVPVQHQAGSKGWKILLLRLGASVVAAFALNAMLPADTGERVARGMAEVASDEFGAVMGAWALGTAWLVGKIIVLIIALMILQRILDEFGLIRIISVLLRPLLWLLGLPGRTAFLWIVANTLGLAYGAPVIIEEAASGKLSKNDVELLNRSIAVCHSLLEDTLLFVAVGAMAFWITAPRLVLAGGVVWGYRAMKVLLPAPAPAQEEDGAPDVTECPESDESPDSAAQAQSSED